MAVLNWMLRTRLSGLVRLVICLPSSLSPSARVTSASGAGQNTPRPLTSDHHQQRGGHQEHERQRRAGRPDHRLAPSPELSRGATGVLIFAPRLQCVFSILAITLPQPLADQFGRRVQEERQDEQQHGTKEQHSIQRAGHATSGTGASGISTAMLADSVLMPSSGLQSISGVLPVAISTIIVSPTARPKPIITAAKIPGLAEGSTTRHKRLPAAGAQGHRGGRHAVRDVGKRVFRQREDDGNHRKTQADGDDDAVPLIVAQCAGAASAIA